MCARARGREREINFLSLKVGWCGRVTSKQNTKALVVHIEIFPPLDKKNPQIHACAYLFSFLFAFLVVFPLGMLNYYVIYPQRHRASSSFFAFSPFETLVTHKRGNRKTSVCQWDMGRNCEMHHGETGDPCNTMSGLVPCHRMIIHQLRTDQLWSLRSYNRLDI